MTTMPERLRQEPNETQRAKLRIAHLLSSRETEILTLAAQGQTYAAIARALRVSADAVKDHLERIRRKLNATNKTSSVAIAVARGIIKLPES